MTARLDGQVALVTGGASGLGLALARRFLDEGASVTILDRDAGALEEAAAGLGAPDRVLSAVADVTDPAALHDAVDRTVAAFGRLDTLVPNAGIWDYRRSLTRLDGPGLAAVFDEVFAVNVKGYLLTVEAAWRALVASGGSVTMTLSNASFYADGGGPAYTASKFAVRGLVVQLAHELAPKVRVNGVAVGAMRTGLRGPASIGLGERAISASYDRAGRGSEPNLYVPLHDASVDPADLTAPYVLLAAKQESGNMTGTVIQVDGGLGVRGFSSAAGGDAL